MSRISSSEARVLAKIKRQFAKFRSIGGGPYPPRLKSMALAAVGEGLGKSSVARAAGVAPSMIYYWMSGAPTAKQLKLVESPAAHERETVSKASVVCIRLCSGVEIDIPPGELSGELLASLNALGGQR